MAFRFAAYVSAAFALSGGSVATSESCREDEDVASLMMLKQSIGQGAGATPWDVALWHRHARHVVRQGTVERVPPQGTLYVESEYATLREVVVGIGNGKQPSAEAAWFEGALKVLPEEERAPQLKTVGKYYSDYGKDEALEKENDALIEILEKLGVNVHRPAALSNATVAANFGGEWVDKNGYAQVFSRDPIFVVGDNIIEVMMSQPNRRADLLGINSLVRSAQENASNPVKLVQMPIVDVEDMTKEGYDKFKEPHLEGGDLLVFNETHVLAGVSDNKVCGSSTKGVEWLQSVLPKHTVKKVGLVEGMLHLDCAMSVPKKGVAVVCKECMHKEDYESMMNDELKGWKVIEVSLKEGKLMQTNGLPVDEKNYILGFNNGADGTKIKEALSKEGITVHLVNFTVHNQDGGSIRCATHPFLRKN